MGDRDMELVRLTVLIIYSMSGGMVSASGGKYFLSNNVSRFQAKKEFGRWFTSNTTKLTNAAGYYLSAVRKQKQYP